MFRQVFKKPWPSMLRTVYGDRDRFESTYFQKFPGYYYTGDGKFFDMEMQFYIMVPNLNPKLLFTRPLLDRVVRPVSVP